MLFVHIEFNARQRTSCINITIFYPKAMSNVLFVLDQYGEEGSKIIYNQTQTISWHRTFWKRAFIQSVVINMSACSFVVGPVWDLFVRTRDMIDRYYEQANFSRESYILPATVFQDRYVYVTVGDGSFAET